MIINKLKNLNFLLIFLLILISFIGAAGLYSAADGSYYPWAFNHIVRFYIFLILAIVISIIDLRLIYKYSYYIFILSLLLLFSVEIIGVFGKGATRWIKILGFSIQPSELVKTNPWPIPAIKVSPAYQLSPILFFFHFFVGIIPFF